MKFKATFIANCSAIIAIANAVACEWLDSKPGNTYDDYCKENGAKANIKHVCFPTNPSFFFTIESDSSFTGIISSDLMAFVLIPTPAAETAHLSTAACTVDVDFTTADQPPQANCAYVKVDRRAGGLSGEMICQPTQNQVPVCN
ncbi:uncharacterized protein UTRI_00317 [Ustilago trichophora]|uniref:Uncharacterized protein n=1 Tax=Ustilago trichophora TaxID=86804 RepID=A0A5C3DT76_9BASI|nr:uncharacterized protein UTRI_00317 [Ustilago trichophora]